MPLKAPAAALERIAMGRDVASPQSNEQIMVQVRPIRIVGFRPNLSEALPQSMAVRHCDRENTAEVIPAYFGTSSLAIPKLSIISGCKMSVTGIGGGGSD